MRVKFILARPSMTRFGLGIPLLKVLLVLWSVTRIWLSNNSAITIQVSSILTMAAWIQFHCTASLVANMRRTIASGTVMARHCGPLVVSTAFGAMEASLEQV